MGQHQRGNYKGFSEEQHDIDVSGNNALIDELEKALEDKQPQQEKGMEQNDEE